MTCILHCQHGRRSVQADYAGITYHQFEQKHPTSSFFRIPFGEAPDIILLDILYSNIHINFQCLENPPNSAHELKKKANHMLSSEPQKMQSSTLKTVFITSATSTRVSRGRKFQTTASQRQKLPCFSYKTCPTEPLSLLVRVLSHVGFVLDCPTCACPTIPNPCQS